MKSTSDPRGADALAAPAGQGTRSANVIRAELGAVDSEYDRIQAKMFKALDRTGDPQSRPSDYELAKCRAEAEALLMPLAAKRLRLADELRAAEVSQIVELNVQKLRSSQGRIAAHAKLANDPKQAAKAEAFKLWQEWHAGRTRHKSGAAFARHVVETFPIIESTKAVERWATQWRKDAKPTK